MIFLHFTLHCVIPDRLAKRLTYYYSVVKSVRMALELVIARDGIEALSGELYQEMHLALFP